MGKGELILSSLLGLWYVSLMSMKIVMVGYSVRRIFFFHLFLYIFCFRYLTFRLGFRSLRNGFTILRERILIVGGIIRRQEYPRPSPSRLPRCSRGQSTPISNRILTSSHTSQ